MIPIPWKYIASWNCTACGLCCRGFRVTIKFNEWMKIVQAYGVGVTSPGLNKFYLKRRSDGTCIFLHKLYDMWRPRSASYGYRDKTLFIYADPVCEGIRWGNPTQEFAHATLPELVQITLGLQEKQYYSTSRIFYQPWFNQAKGRKIV